MTKSTTRQQEVPRFKEESTMRPDGGNQSEAKGKSIVGSVMFGCQSLDENKRKRRDDVEKKKKRPWSHYDDVEMSPRLESNQPKTRTRKTPSQRAESKSKSDSTATAPLYSPVC